MSGSGAPDAGGEQQLAGQDAAVARYWQRWRVATWVLSATVLGSLVISVVVGWNANSTFERVRDSVIAVVSTGFTFVALRWCAGQFRRFADRYLMTDPKAALVVEEALAKGLLPPAYRRSRGRDRAVAKTIRSDRKIGFTEAEIERDLEDFVD